MVRVVAAVELGAVVAKGWVWRGVVVVVTTVGPVGVSVVLTCVGAVVVMLSVWLVRGVGGGGGATSSKSAG